jgi:titin
MTHVNVFRRLPARAGRRLALALVIAVSGAIPAFGPDGTPAAQASGIAAPSVFSCNGGFWTGYTVPGGFTELYVEAGGAEGGMTTGTPGGKGGSVQAVVPVASGENVGVLVGCRGGNGNSQQGGAAGRGFGRGGPGGATSLGEDGAGGGGGSAVTSFDQTVEYVVAGGGGGGGGDATVDGGAGGGRGGNGSQTGAHGNGGGGTGNPGGAGGASATRDGEKGWGTSAGGAGGGGGGGHQGGAAGHGGGNAYSGGGGGGGGSSFVRGSSTNVAYTGGAVTGDGYVVLVPMKPWSALPTVGAFPCNNGAPVNYTVPTGVVSVNVTASGGSGGAGGARVQATVPVVAGAHFTAIAGCAASTGGKGYGNGGTGGSTGAGRLGDNDGGNGGGGSALLDAGGKPVVVAGGGGGNGGGGTFTGGGSGGAGSQNGNSGSGGGGSPGGSGGSGGGLSSPNHPNGRSGSDSRSGGGGAGGGGGYNGGNGGGNGEVGTGGGGGGGGSSFAVATATNVSYEDGVSGGNGYVVIAAVPVSVPDAPTNLLPTTGVNQVTVEFLPPVVDGGANVTSYTVTASPGGATATGTSSPITVTGLTGTTPYTFTVQATNVVGSGPPSAPSSPVLAYLVPDAPAISSVTAGDGRATVAFTPRGSGGQPITSYTATARTGSPTATGPGITATGSSSPLTLTGLTDGTPYFVTVYATNLAGNSLESGAFPVLPASLPGAPTSVTATLISGGVSVAFTPPTNTGGAPINSYTVTSNPGGITATGGQGPITVRGLTNGVTYTFTVVATTAAGNGPASAASNPVTPQAFTIPSPPLVPSAAAGNQQAAVSFAPPFSDGGSPITSYTVTSNPGGITASGTSSPIMVSGLINGSSYTFTVVATNAAGNSQPSAASNAVTPSATIPGAPPAPAASARNQAAIVNVTPPSTDGGSPITSYTVTSNPGGITATGAAGPVTVTGLTNDTSYTFTVVATNALGNSPPSAASNAVTPSASLAPANDDFANAHPITGDTGSVSGSNVNATTETGEPGPAGASVWYVWPVSHGGVVQIDTCGSSFTPAVGVYTGTAVNALTPLASSTVPVFCGTTNTWIAGLQVALPPNGGTIYIAIDGGVPSNPVMGQFNFHWGMGG